MTMTKTDTAKVWFITGTSTGFGRLLVEKLLADGDRVVATARKLDTIAAFGQKYPETALAVTLDVTSDASVDAAVQAALAKFGHVDVLINNAGYGLAGAIEEATEAEFMPVFETNVFGLLRVTRALLPHFRQQKSGHIVNLSSVAGLIGTPGWGYYNASKFAVNGLSEALAAEMEPLGVKVTVIEPGPFRTEFLGSSGKAAAKKIPEYEPTAGKTREYQETQNGKQPGDPAKAVEAIVAVGRAANPPKHLLLGKLAYDRMQVRLELWQKQLEETRETTLGADFAAESSMVGSR
jgi:NAD(P)-dependent dehydrogenase (short-subunit alcohol dehydrogenase family)